MSDSQVFPGPETVFDVAVIGGGVVGCAVLRELSRYDLRLLLLEKESDLAEGISKGNSGVIHAGFNVPTGSLKARLNVEGLRRIYKLAAEIGAPHRRTGKLVVAFSDADRPRLEGLVEQGRRNGSPDLEIVDAAGIARLAPGVAGRWALSSPWTGIISPYEFTLALAECAVRNGARVALEAGVSAVEVTPEGFRLITARGPVRARRVVNSAGLFADETAGLAGPTDYKVLPTRGEYLIADREAGTILPLPVYPVPPRGDSFLGVHLTPTLNGNVLLGPSSEEVSDKSDTATTAEVLEKLKREAFALLPGLARFPFIHAYAGLRPKRLGPGGAPASDFLIQENPRRLGWIDLIGIESPGLTAAPAIAALVADMLGSALDLRPRTGFEPALPPRPRFSAMEDAERAERAAADPAWGEMICRCEHVTRAEVEAALGNPFGARSLDAVKRRTRCGMGRCQGGLCTPRLVDLLEAGGLAPEEIRKRGPGSHLFYGRIKP